MLAPCTLFEIMGAEGDFNRQSIQFLLHTSGRQFSEEVEASEEERD